MPTLPTLALAAALVAANGEEFTGFIVDNYCWDKDNHRGIDNTLLGTEPQNHILHCLTWTPCIPGGYTMLKKLDSADADGYTYKSEYQLDSNGDKLVVEMTGKEMMRGGDRKFNVEWTVKGSLTGKEIAVDEVCITPEDVQTPICIGMTDMGQDDKDCKGSWSACTAKCEKGAERMFTMTQMKSGNGKQCDPAEDCTTGMGGCVNDGWTTDMTGCDIAAAGVSTLKGLSCTCASGSQSAKKDVCCRGIQTISDMCGSLKCGDTDLEAIMCGPTTTTTAPAKPETNDESMAPTSIVGTVATGLVFFLVLF